MKYSDNIYKLAELSIWRQDDLFYDCTKLNIINKDCKSLLRGSLHHIIENQQNVLTLDEFDILTIYKVIDIDYRSEHITYKKVKVKISSNFFNKLLIKDIIFYDFISDIINNTKIKHSGGFNTLKNIVLESNYVLDKIPIAINNIGIDNIMKNL